MSKHTPGPWTVNTEDYTNAIGIECKVDGIGHTVVTDQFCYPSFQQHPSKEKLANAYLIAAAPDMLEALLNLEDDDNSIPPHAWDLVQAAISKAVNG